MVRDRKPLDYYVITSGPYVGKTCDWITQHRRTGQPSDKCEELAIFSLTPYGDKTAALIACGRHSAQAIKEIHETGKSVVVQMIPVIQRRRKIT